MGRGKILAYSLVALVPFVMAALFYFSPKISFHQMRAALDANDIDSFSTEIEITEIQRHLRNQMSLQMQRAISSYTWSPDHDGTDAGRSSYFDKRATSIATAASTFDELASQLKGKSGDSHVKFINFSTADVIWSSQGQTHQIRLARHGFDWKLTAMEFPDAMPRFWGQPTSLSGIYYGGTFWDCCWHGNASKATYRKLELTSAIDILDAAPLDPDTDTSLSNVLEIQIMADAELMKHVKDGDKIAIQCLDLYPGTTGHSALPVACDADKVDSISPHR